jgi:hypothetical protein
MGSKRTSALRISLGKKVTLLGLEKQVAITGVLSASKCGSIIGFIHPVRWLYIKAKGINALFELVIKEAFYHQFLFEL